MFNFSASSAEQAALDLSLLLVQSFKFLKLTINARRRLFYFYYGAGVLFYAPISNTSTLHPACVYYTTPVCTTPRLCVLHPACVYYPTPVYSTPHVCTTPRLCVLRFFTIFYDLKIYLLYT